MTTRLALFLAFLLPALAPAQNWEDLGEHRVDWGGYLFGVKGGLSGGNQDWTGLETELMLGFHGAAFLESIPAQGKFSLWAQLGYHTRGSRISRRRAFTFSGNRVTLPSDDFRFQNIALGVGGKQVVAYTKLADLYYSLGLRIEYNVSTNLGEYDRLSSTQGIGFRLNYPFDSPDFINPVVYGASVGGGAIIPLTDGMSGFIELSAHPDFNYQYNQPPIENVIDPFGGGPRTIGERAIRNFTLELSVGIRFLRSWRYID